MTPRCVIQALIELGIRKKDACGGRSTSYSLKEPGRLAHSGFGCVRIAGWRERRMLNEEAR
jgi:hypothetical protein